ncbi:hypothetical protein BDR04DRAFT_1093319, partial [Suillus decipiens]
MMSQSLIGKFFTIPFLLIPTVYFIYCNPLICVHNARHARSYPWDFQTNSLPHLKCRLARLHSYYFRPDVFRPRGPLHSEAAHDQPRLRIAFFWTRLLPSFSSSTHAVVQKAADVITTVSAATTTMSAALVSSTSDQD